MPKKNTALINNLIEASDVLLINERGVKEGIIPLKDALKKAETLSLDLVKVSFKDSQQDVCKQLYYRKYSFSMDKNISKAKYNTKTTYIKESKYSLSTDAGGDNIKLQ